MQSSPSPLSSSLGVIFGGILVAAIIAVGCSTPGGGGTAAGASRGERFFKTKCNSCHPNGGQGAGPPIDLGMAPDFLERGKTSGRHAVPEPDWEPLLAYMNQSFGGGTAVAVAETPPAPPPPPAVGGTTPPPPPPPPPTAVAAGDTAAGSQYYQAKCAKCHPGGSKIAGKALPGVLVAGGSGKHGVEAAQFDNVLSYLVTLGAVRTGTPAAVASTPTPTPAVAVAVAPPAGGGGGGDVAAGGQYYQAKCAKCHPGGAKIAGKVVPGTKMISGGSGKHGIEAAQFDNVMAFLVTLGAVRTGGGPTAAAPGGGGAPPPPPPPTTTTGDGTIPMNAGMVNCSCSCQCPAGAPPEALPAACLCQCSCPR